MLSWLSFVLRGVQKLHLKWQYICECCQLHQDLLRSDIGGNPIAADLGGD